MVSEKTSFRFRSNQNYDTFRQSDVTFPGARILIIRGRRASMIQLASRVFSHLLPSLRDERLFFCAQDVELRIRRPRKESGEITEKKKQGAKKKISLRKTPEHLNQIPLF